MGIERFPDRSGRDESRADRVQAIIRCEVRQGSRDWKAVQLENISILGFCIASYPECRPELPVRIRIPGLQLLHANVCWKEGAQVGCEFTQPLHVAVFEHIIGQTRA